jgi:hypothetical protein
LSETLPDTQRVLSVLCMPAKDPEMRRATVRAWYARTKHTRRTPELLDRERQTKLIRRRKLSRWLVELKSSLLCARCGENHPACLQFHHPDPVAKEMSVCDAVRRGWSHARILVELNKCEVLCANCHAKHHAKERAG